MKHAQNLVEFGSCRDVKSSKHLSIGEGGGQALEVDAWTEYAEGGGPFVFVVEDGMREELLKLDNVAMGNVIA